MESRSPQLVRSRVEPWIGLAICEAVVACWAIQQLVPNRPDAVQAFAAPDWLPLAAAASAAAAIVPIVRPLASHTAGSVLGRSPAHGVDSEWAAVRSADDGGPHRSPNGQWSNRPVDLYWPGLATRTFALAAAVVLARLALARPAAPASTRPAAWYGYAAFVLALPYPVLRLHWALGGTLGLTAPGAAGEGWDPLLIAVPWAMAAVLSLFLVSPPPWMPRRLLLAAGWSATATVAMIGPAAIWASSARWRVAATPARVTSRSGSSVCSTAAGSSGPSPVGPPPAHISCVARLRGCPRRHDRADLAGRSQHDRTDVVGRTQPCR